MGRDDGGFERFWTAVGRLFVEGVGVDWSAVFAGCGARRVQLPTYAFQRQRFWLTSGPVVGDAGGLGLGGLEHALLGAVVEQPDSGGVVLTGRLVVGSQRWLADHAVGGVVLFPGAGFVELAICAGDEVGCAVVQELMLSAPLVLREGGGVQVQVVVGGLGELGSRAVSVYSRGSWSGAEWVLHAEGVLGVAADPVGVVADLSVWPPVGAVAVDVSDAYERLAAHGYEYGPAFQGLEAVWSRGQEIFAEVALPEEAGDTEGWGIHPVVLDAVLHAAGLAASAFQTGQVVLPFSWQQVSLHASGASRVRARIAAAGADAVTVELADAEGLPVLSVGSLTTRPVTAQQLHAALSGAGEVDQGLFEVVWSPVAGEGVVENGDRLAVISWEDLHSGSGIADISMGEADDSAASSLGIAADVVVWEWGSADEDVVSSVYAATHQVLEVLQSWLAEDRPGRLMVVTHGAVAIAGEDITDLAAAAVWGMVRSAQTEHPGRLCSSAE